MEEILRKIGAFFKRGLTRRSFLKVGGASLAVLLSQKLFPTKAFAAKKESAGRKKSKIKGDHDIVLAEGRDPYKNTEKAIELLGGMGRFVKKGSVVVIKPNMAWDRTPEQASNTNPYVVGCLVDLCFKAGAKRVNVFDVPCNDARRVYNRSGIAEMAKKKGASVYFADHWNVVKARFPYPSPMEKWPVLRDAVECDTFINVPVLKHHGLTGLTLSMKNLMGVCSGTRGLIHIDIGRKLVDLTDFISPDLTVIDATRVLVKHGPSGGNMEDVVVMNKVFAGTDPTLCDSYACSLMKKDPSSVPYIAEAIKKNFGNADISKAKIHTVKV